MKRKLGLIGVLYAAILAAIAGYFFRTAQLSSGSSVPVVAFSGMTLNAETGEWSITTELAAGNYKFRANNKWDINLGGDLNHLTYGGDNITTEAGTYVITLKLGDASNYHATVVKR